MQSATGLAIPALRGVPRPNNQFSTLDHLVALTLQIGLKKDLSFEDMFEFINQLKEEYKERRAAAKMMFKAAFDLFSRLATKTSISQEIMSIGEDEIEKFVVAANENPDLKFDFHSLATLQKIRVFPHKISSSSHEVVNFSKTVQGGSGTVVETNPICLKTEENRSARAQVLLQAG